MNCGACGLPMAVKAGGRGRPRKYHKSCGEWVASVQNSWWRCEHPDYMEEYRRKWREAHPDYARTWLADKKTKTLRQQIAVAKERLRRENNPDARITPEMYERIEEMLDLGDDVADACRRARRLLRNDSA